jgi:RNA polymerase sigma factor (sigma-70 family)
MDSSESLKALLKQLCLQDEAAEQAFFDRYVARLRALAQKRLSPRLLSKFDPDDIVQSVFFSFFAGVRAGKYAEFRDSVWCLLATMTVRKCIDKHKLYATSRRNVDQEVSGEPAAPGAPAAWDTFNREPTPEEVAMAGEFLERFEKDLTKLPPQYAQVFRLTMEGANREEIAEELGLSTRTVDRAKQAVWALLEQTLDACL